ncbi:hypothetical protein NON08_06165 [Cetobacterium somerae]|uniref:hypothetical protein n=1 Tax=Cetobacterium sp. NK01 TaxID=2993530 RepID=UPI0021170B03|nr:hypothetical protein [Cetobacterium sp. NK01]MCQ8212108.1 hypothetical protein [Cetobacterium sp. NK01]
MTKNNFIIKNHHKTNYTVIYNKFIQDKNLNLELIGFGIYLLSKPSNWIINPHQIRSDLNIGKDKIARLINTFIDLGYMYRQKKDITFTAKGELKNVYYFCDDKELLNKTTEIFRSDETTFHLPLSEIPPLQIAVTETPTTELPHTENPPYNNTNDTNDNNKKNTLLTSSVSIRTYLKDILDDFTIVNLLSAKPDLTIDEFNRVYNLANLEFKNGRCNNVNACLVKAIKGEWNFLPISISESKEDDKIHRILHSKVIYFQDLFKNSSFSKDEIFSKFLIDSQKYDEKLVAIYYKNLKEKLES